MCCLISFRIFRSGERLRNLDITVGPTENYQQMICGHFIGPGYTGQRIEIPCTDTLLGRYIKLVLTKPNATSFWHIAEVSIFAYV